MPLRLFLIIFHLYLQVREERRGGKGLREAVERRKRISELMKDPAKMRAEKERIRDAKRATSCAPAGKD